MHLLCETQLIAGDKAIVRIELAPNGRAGLSVPRKFLTVEDDLLKDEPRWGFEDTDQQARFQTGPAGLYCEPEGTGPNGAVRVVIPTSENPEDWRSITVRPEQLTRTPQSALREQAA